MFSVAAFYRFVEIADRVTLRDQLLSQCQRLNIIGSVLLADEGINGTIAGSSASLDALHLHFDTIPELKQMAWKISHCNTPPFKRLKVRLKREIVTMGMPSLSVAGNTGTYVSPQDWDALIARNDVVLIDTRNVEEVANGTFVGAINPHIAKFSDFPAWIDQQCGIRHDQPVAMFCTGGIRCEKTTALMRTRGFTQVYHLSGGILAYLEHTKNANKNWHGTCFVFDDRETVDDDLRPAERIKTPQL
jgi:UPF0176 protein